MPILDVVRAALSRPAGRIVEVPVRELVNKVVEDHGFAGPADLARLRAEIAELGERVAILEARLAKQG